MEFFFTTYYLIASELYLKFNIYLIGNLLTSLLTPLIIVKKINLTTFKDIFLLTLFNKAITTH